MAIHMYDIPTYRYIINIPVDSLVTCINGKFPGRFDPKVILPMSDTALVDNTANTNEGILKGSRVPLSTDLLPEFKSTPKSSKRRLSGEKQFYESYDLSHRRRESPRGLAG